jgi:ATP adenylyltransferase
MDFLWTPWRYAYVTNADRETGCIFCDAPKESDEKVRIVHRGAHCYIILNIYPYTNGHVMIVPYAHLDELQKLPADAAQEMMALSQRMESVLRSLYRPDGINLGMNLGKAAGAGVSGHIHMHVLPRWIADASFVTVIGETRIMPEALEDTWKKLHEALE